MVGQQHYTHTRHKWSSGQVWCSVLQFIQNNLQEQNVISLRVRRDSRDMTADLYKIENGTGLSYYSMYLSKSSNTRRHIFCCCCCYMLLLFCQRGFTAARGTSQDQQHFVTILNVLQNLRITCNTAL